MIKRINDNNYNRKITKESQRKRNFKESYRDAVDFYWKIDENDAYDAYKFACEYFDKEELDDIIVQCLSQEELASCLAFIFKINNVTEYYEDDEDEDEEY